MHVKHLKLTSFRNFESVEIEFAPGANLIFGKNGSGKSNMLESVYYLCTAKSFRGANDDLLRKSDAELFRIEASGELSNSEVQIEIGCKPGEKKRVRINGVPETRLSSLYEHLKAVVFAPDDVELINGPPSVRRTFLDISIAQFDRSYIPLLWEYKRVLAQRNALLKELAEEFAAIGTATDDSSLQVWDTRMAELAVDINARRRKFLADISGPSSEYHHKLTDSPFDLAIEYKPSPSLETFDTARFQQKLESRRRRETMLGQSQYGPHRDDITFRIGDYDFRSYGSRGQVKSVVLSVKLAVLLYLRDVTDEWPILLLDEIYSDFDARRLEYLSSIIPTLGQVLVTTSKLSEVKDLSVFEKSIMVDNGETRNYKS